MTNQEAMLEEFQKLSEQPADEVTLQQMDKLVAQYQEARQIYDQKRKEASDQNSLVEKLEAELMGVLASLGKSSYDAEGIGRVTKCMKLVYRVPKTNEEKLKLFDYIKEKYGATALTAMMSINHNTLTSWANKEVEATGMGTLPGLEAPTSVEYLQLRSKS
jgi:hypothetical protein